MIAAVSDFNKLARHRIRESFRLLGMKDRTFHQKWNYLMFKLAFKQKKLKVSHYPIKLTIDPCNACNLRCAFCPTGVRDTGRRLSKMKFETFKKLMDECGKYLWEIDFFNWGEPFLNKKIFDMIEYTKPFKIVTNVSSNLNFCDDDIAEKMVRSQLNKLITSLDGASQETIQTYQVGNDFKLVTENLRRVVEWKRKLNSDLPFIQWRYLVTKHNEHEVEQAKEMAKDIGVDYLELARFRCSMGDEVFMDNKEQFKNAEEWLPTNQDFSMYQYEDERKKHLRQVCSRPWYESVVHPDGNVAPCCSVWYQKYDFGNIIDKSFRDVWNGDMYRQSRSLFDGSGSEHPGHICDTCKKNNAIY